MRPNLHAQLINDPLGDPGVYVQIMFEKRGLLLDLGDLARLPARKLLHISHVFVSHTHMDHFSGFDRLLRVCLGREKSLHLFGPTGFIDRVAHKLAAYTWNLVQNYASDFTLVVHELRSERRLATARFRCRTGFSLMDQAMSGVSDGMLLDEEGLSVRATILDHDIPCLAFAIEERRHINIWKNRVEEMGFPVGPWLKEFKAAVLRGEDEDRQFRVWWREDGETSEAYVPLGTLKKRIARIVPGQKICYVTDVAHSSSNVTKILELASEADLLFIEAPFLHDDADIAARRWHLTARQAGQIARSAKVRQLLPFHFSPRYSDAPECLEAEAFAAFGNDDPSPRRCAGRVG